MTNETLKVNIKYARHILKNVEICICIDSLKNLKGLESKSEGKEKKFFQKKLKTAKEHLSKMVKQFLTDYNFSLFFLAENEKFIKKNCNKETVDLYRAMQKDFVSTEGYTYEDFQSDNNLLIDTVSGLTENTIEFFDDYTGTNTTALEIKSQLSDCTYLKTARSTEENY